MLAVEMRAVQTVNWLTAQLFLFRIILVKHLKGKVRNHMCMCFRRGINNMAPFTFLGISEPFTESLQSALNYSVL